MHKSVQDCVAILVLMSMPTHYVQFIILLLIIIIHMTAYTGSNYWFRGRRKKGSLKWLIARKIINLKNQFSVVSTQTIYLELKLIMMIRPERRQNKPKLRENYLNWGYFSISHHRFGFIGYKLQWIIGNLLPQPTINPKP